MTSSSSPGRPALAVAALAVGFGMVTACAPRPDDRADPAARAALLFSHLYFESADPEAAVGVTDGEAAAQMRAQAAARSGLPAPPRPRAAVRLSRRESYEEGALVKYRVEVRAWPLAADARGTPPDSVPFDLFLRREARDPGGWRVVSIVDGR
jgi:hypothetical protein